MDKLTITSRLLGGLAAVALGLGLAAAPASAADPIIIGFSQSLTGPLAVNGKAALLAQQIWEEDVNAKGGLLGRPVKLIYYDDQSNPSTVPGIYQKLISVDKANVLVSGYATVQIAPALPVMIQNNKTFVSLFGLAVNSEFHYDRYFSMIPSGPDPKPAFTAGFFDVAMAQSPKPTTVAIASADMEFAHNCADGGRENIKKTGLKIVYDKTYPPNTTDFSPIVRAVQAANPDVFLICSYVADSTGMVQALNEIGYKPKMVGGGMVGLQSPAIKTKLGPMLNGIVDYDMWEPAPKLQSADIDAFLKKYQAKAASAGVDPLGYYLPPFAYAQMQVVAQAVEGTKGLDDAKLADYMRSQTFKTVVGDVKFGKDGEWATSKMLQVQFHGLKDNSLDQFKDVSHQTIVAPAEYASGKLIYPFEEAKK
ncbi:MAG TPA: amino acid ABC transporter substrate-binding protein [Methylomirabilota bacterium]|nr:amino acid ABC transporter substrate-binding protein [Methylomirabilota bacterium]